MIEIRLGLNEAWINGQHILKPRYATPGEWRTYGPRRIGWLYRAVCMDNVVLDANVIRRPLQMGRTEWLDYWERDNLPGEIDFSERAWAKRYPNAQTNADRYRLPRKLR